MVMDNITAEQRAVERERKTAANLDHVLGYTGPTYAKPMHGEKPITPVEKVVFPFGPAPRDSGGLLYTYMNTVLTADILGKEVRIAGTCISACTVYLGAKRACVEPDAVLWFHAAHDPKTRVIDRRATELMATYWPQPVRDWAQKNRAMERIEFTTLQALTGRELIGMGVRRCA